MMSDEKLRPAAEFYGISLEEARERNRKCEEQNDDPNDPMCMGCARRPPEIDGYVEMVKQEGMIDTIPEEDQVRVYVIRNEGTYNPNNGHFFCDDCYIINGMPSSSRGWVCP